MKIKLADQMKAERNDLRINRYSGNRKNKDYELRKMNSSGAFIKKQEAQIKKESDRDTAKLKTDPKAKRHPKLVKEYLDKKKRMAEAYLKDVKKSVKGYKSGGKSGKAYAKQHPLRKKLMGREFQKYKEKLSIRVREKEKGK